MTTPQPPAAPSLDALSVVNRQLYWIEGRHEGDILVGWSDGRTHDVLPPGVHTTSTVHEYGGGAYLAHARGVWFVRAEDQRIWRAARGTLLPVTPPPRHGAHRHADLQMSSGGLLVCVRERHGSDDVVNELVSVPGDGSAEPQAIAQGWDFYSSPRISPDGSRLAWLTWNKPLMPWDGTWLWVADLRPDGLLGKPTLLAGGENESVTQPQWSPDGVLHYITDRTGWWNVCADRDGHTDAVTTVDAELAPAPWEFGYSTYQFLDNRRIATIVQRGCQTSLGISYGDGRAPEPVRLPYTWIKPYLATDRGRLAVIGATPTRAPHVALVNPSTAAIQELTAGHVLASGAAQPDRIRLRTRRGSYSHALLHAAAHSGSGGSARLKQPLLVRPHPGPTANTQLRADPWVSFFTSHGFVVLDVDYSGSTGYGRAYRNSLRGNWGVLDVSDCVDAVEHLVAGGHIDPTRVAICGSSAGGYTALRALATTQTFSAAAVRHTIIDPATWRQAAPKFQAHHADLLVAPPSESATYRERSVLPHANAITAPVLMIHGEQDNITPVSEVRQLAHALGARASLITFADEAHGLRNPNHASQALHTELAHLWRAFRL